MQIAGRCAIKPELCKRFLMVFVKTRTFVAIWKSLCNEVALRKQLRLDKRPV